MFQHSKLMNSANHPEQSLYDSDAVSTCDQFDDSEEETEEEDKTADIDKEFIVKFEPGSDHGENGHTTWQRGTNHCNWNPSKHPVQGMPLLRSEKSDPVSYHCNSEINGSKQLEDCLRACATQLHNKGSNQFKESSKPVHFKIMQALEQSSGKPGTIKNVDSIHDSTHYPNHQWESSDFRDRPAEGDGHCNCQNIDSEGNTAVYGCESALAPVSGHITLSISRRKMEVVGSSSASSMGNAGQPLTSTTAPVLQTSVSASCKTSAVDKPHICQYCSSAFVDSNNLKRHMTYTHQDKLTAAQSANDKNSTEKNNKGSVTCDVCGKVFARPSRLERHKLIHTGQKPFVCDVCNKAFTQAGNLKTHKMLHTGRKPFACELCGKAFSDAGNLKKHQVIHTGDKPFVCDVCDKAFVETGHLKRHKKIHTGQKPYACDVCGKAFIEAGTLRRHKVQTNHNPIICFVCNRNFLDVGRLEEHQKIHVDGNTSRSAIVKTLPSSAS